MKRTLVAVSLLLSLACVHHQAFYGPNGERGYVIQCGGSLHSMASCYNRAHEVCGGPYVVGKAWEGQRITYNIATGDPLVVEGRELTIVCRPPSGSAEAVGAVANESAQ